MMDKHTQDMADSKEIDRMVNSAAEEIEALLELRELSDLVFEVTK